MNVPYVVLSMQGRRQAPNGLFLKRRVFRRGLTLCLAASLWLTVAVPAQATGGVLDANQLVFGTAASSSVTANNRSMLAQTFTAVASGQLDHIWLPVSTPTGPVSLNVEIHNVSGGQPNGALLGSSPPPVNPVLYSCCSWRDFAFDPGINVTAGTQYAIVIYLRFDSITWYDDFHGNSYAGGQPFKFAGGSWASMTNDFAFKTYVVVAAPNSAPMVTVNSSNVPVTEGVVPTNSGTFSDPDGDTVTLTASSTTGSHGTVTPAANGTWSWTGVATDEGPGQTITITADDGHGHTFAASFTTTVGSKPPTAKINGAPASAVEGTTITLTGTALSDSAEDNAAPFTYSWSATENGNALGAGPTSGPTYTIKVNDESTYKVTLTATDDGGFSGQSTVTINGVDSKPSVAVSVSQPFVIVPQEPLAFTGTFTDAGSSVDTSYTPTWTWGDGSPNGAGLNATHAYPASGTYTATLTVTDDDGVAGSASTIVTVLSPAVAMSRIAGYVQSRPGLNGGQKNSLLVKLNAAGDAMQRGNTGAACNQLGAFGNEADAQQKAGHLTSGEAATMIDAARVTQRSMGCFRTLVDFLSGL